MGLGEVQGGSQEVAAVGWMAGTEMGSTGDRGADSKDATGSAAKHSRSIFSQILEAIVWC